MAASSHRVAFLQAFQKERLCTNLSHLRENDILCDVTLLSSGGLFKAHKVVLAASSDYFNRLLTGEKEYDAVTFSSVSPTAMQTLLDYIYSGRINVTSEHLFDVLYASHVMGVSELYAYCSAVLIHRLALHNFRQAWDAAETYGDANLRDAVFDFCLDNMEVLRNKNEFLEINLQCLTTLLSHERLSSTVNSEDAFIHALIAWVSYNSNREPHLVELMDLINVDRVSEAMVKLLEKDGWLERYPVLSKVFPKVSREQKKPKSLSMLFRLPPINTTVTTMVAFIEETCGKTVTSHYNITENSWNDGTSVCLPLSNFSLATLGGSVFIIGGEKDGRYQRDVSEFKPGKQQLVKLPPMNCPRIHAGASAFKGKVYAAGGFNDGEYLQSVECYEIGKNNKWTFLEDMSEKKLGVQIAVLNQKLIAVGGWNGFSHVTTVECYDPAVNQWTLMAPLLYGRSFAGVVPLGDMLYVLGGSVNGKDADTSSCIQCYYVHEKLWQIHKATTPHQHFCNCACPHKGLIYLLTEDGYLFVFDPRTGEWQERRRHRPIGWCKNGVLVQSSG